MLTRHISKQVTISDNGKQLKYTCYGDTENKNKFYVIPETPEYVRDADGKLKFKFLSYTGSAVSANASVNEGAYCTFTVRLPFPNESQKDKIRMLLNEGLQAKLEPRAKKTFAMVQAYQQNPQGDWKTLADALGLAEAEVKALSNQFKPNQTWEQYLQIPSDTAQIQLERVPFIQEGSKVELTLQDAAGAFLQRQLNPLVPSMMGDLETVFALPLTSQGAALYEAAFKGESDTPSIVGVIYTMCFECRLPDTTVDVSYKFDRQRAFSKTPPNAWGTKSEVIKDELSNKEAAQIKIQEGSWEGFTDKEKADLRKELEEWGKEQLNAILTQKLTTLDMTKIGQRFSSGQDASELLKDVGDIQRSYQAGRVVTYIVKPQVQLPGIAQIVGTRVNDYFQDVDLNSDRFQKKSVNVQINADSFEALKINTINVKLEYDDKTREKQVKTLTFTSSQPQTWSWYMRTGQDGKKISTYRYSYQVTYKGESKIFEFKAQETADDILMINVDGTGVLRANVKVGKIDWGKVQRAQVMLKYEESSTDENKQEMQIVLSDTNASTNYVQPIFKPQTKPILYRTKFYMKDGQEFWYAPGDTGPVDWATKPKSNDPNLFIVEPFKQTKQYTIQIDPDTVPKGMTSVKLTVRYKQSSVGYTTSKSVTLSKSVTSASWEVPVIDEAAAVVEYDGYVELQGAADQMFSGTATPKQSTIPIVIQLAAKPQPSQFSIKFSKEGMDWSEVKQAKVFVQYDSEEAKRIYISSDRPEGEEVEFTTEIAKKKAGVPIFDHQLRVEFTMSDNTVKYFPSPTATSTKKNLPMESSSINSRTVYLEEMLSDAAKLQVAV
jgi:hypothetical protein